MGWIACTCGHIAQHHNRAGHDDLPPDLPDGQRSEENHRAVRTWGCDECPCENYDGLYQVTPGAKGYLP